MTNSLKNVNTSCLIILNITLFFFLLLTENNFFLYVTIIYLLMFLSDKILHILHHFYALFILKSKI